MRPSLTTRCVATISNTFRAVEAPVPERFRAMGSLEFSKLLLEKALVAVSPGIGFGPLGEGHVRFALIENDHRIRQATRAIGQFLKGD